jgi:two-component system response regulator DesR
MIAEDQTMVRQALVALLELEPDIQVVAQAADGDEALAMAAGASGFLLKDAPAADLAARLQLSPGTVRNHLSAAIQRLGARNRAEAVQIAQPKGWL